MIYKYVNIICNTIKYIGIKNTYYKVLNKFHQIKISKRYYKLNVNIIKKEESINRNISQKIKISIVVPIYNTEDSFLEEMIESVKNQSYKNWELCLADGGGKKSNYEIIKKYIDTDTRIKYKKLSCNGGIAYNTNKAIELATGDYIGFLDHDDIIEKDALEEVIFCIENNNCDIVYTDEDKISEDGKIFKDPHIKPDWSPRLLKSYNYICHFFIVNKDLIKKYGGIHEGYEGSQDYEFIMRMCRNTSKIAHIPKILYHWRISSTSTAGDFFSKSYAIESGKNALQSALKEENIYAHVTSGNFIGSNNIVFSNCEEQNINIIIYGESLKYNKIKNNIEELKLSLKLKEADIFIYDIKLKNILNSQGNEIKLKDFEIKLQKNKYTLVINEQVKVIGENIINTLIGELKLDNTYMVSPINLNKKSNIISMGLAISKGKIKKIYSGHNFNKKGYMGRLSISNNVFSIEPIVFFTYSNILIEDLGLSFNDKKKWIEISIKALEEKKYYSVITNVKAYSKININWDDINIQIIKDPYFPIIEYID